MAQNLGGSHGIRAGLMALLLAGCAGGTRAEKATPWPADATFSSVVMHCVPAEMPASFVIERGENLARSGPRFEETRDTVLTTLGLLLDTGSWAGERIKIASSQKLTRAGVKEECEVLRAFLGGAAPARFPLAAEGPAPAPGWTVVSAIVNYDYQPARVEAQSIPPRLEVAVVALLVRGDGGVVSGFRATATTDYARVSLGYEERTAQEVTQALVQRVSQALSQQVKQLAR